MRVTSIILSLVSFAACTTLATAATGVFSYRYDLSESGNMENPASGTCINVPEASDDTPADSPKDDTDRGVTLFLDFDCEGETKYDLRAHKSLSSRLKFRSVKFH
ncbi:hypothetical protein K457DRAFT_13054 [Linnemannia elongata AG-77]|uniref:Uncharacterized protein n=1 Tax=Linnemannia elongata AG-77 TaxID=1314771 RepID=A0A197KGM6_9FUNG|nr:hypothetical protein K457DRAFT_13054 [Linnemannia elongata AG-77]